MDTTLTDLLIDAVRDDNSHGIIGLLQQGANPNGTLDQDGLTPLCFALTKNRVKIIQILLAAGADIHLYIPGYECTILDYAISTQRTNIVNLLLQSINTINKDYIK